MQRDLFGELRDLFGAKAGFSPAQTVGATELALLAAEHLQSAIKLHNLTELARLLGGLNLLHAYLTQTVQEIAAHVHERTFPGLAEVESAVVAQIVGDLALAGTNNEFVAGLLKEAHQALRPDLDHPGGSTPPATQPLKTA